MRSTDDSAKLFADACAVIPGGVNSPVRAFTSVGGTPRFITSAKGYWLTDADGNRYVDLVCSWGPMILGHAHPAVVEAVQRAAAGGLSFGAPTPAETELAAEIIGRVAAVERLRLVNSGTEATMSAIRLARGYTGRAKIIKFSGCYHGHSDALLADAGLGRRDAGPAVLAGRHRRRGRRHDRVAVQQHPRGRGGVRPVRRRDRLRDHRGQPGQHGHRPAAARLQRRAAPHHRRPRRAADLSTR